MELTHVGVVAVVVRLARSGGCRLVLGVGLLRRVGGWVGGGDMWQRAISSYHIWRVKASGERVRPGETTGEGRGDSTTGKVG